MKSPDETARQKLIDNRSSGACISNDPKIGVLSVQVCDLKDLQCWTKI